MTISISQMIGASFRKTLFIFIIDLINNLFLYAMPKLYLAIDYSLPFLFLNYPIHFECFHSDFSLCLIIALSI